MRTTAFAALAIIGLSLFTTEPSLAAEIKAFFTAKAGRALLKFLTVPAATAVWKDNGIEAAQ
jgi:hypothetical protein